MEKTNTKNIEQVGTQAVSASVNSQAGTEIDFQKAGAVWNKPFITTEDLFSTELALPSGPLRVPSLMLGLTVEKMRFVAYDNALGVRQGLLANFIKPGELAISIKHHGPGPDDGEQPKFQCTHVQIAVGVEGGVLTINNPQDYEAGLFGSPSYPMIFVKPVLPGMLSPEIKKAYFDNIRTWLIIANTFSVFPGNYDGGDPLTCDSVEKVQMFGEKLIDALLGDESAKEWFEDPEHKLYCAELAYTALNLGIHFPLNKAALGDKFEKVQEALKSKAFVAANKNPYADLVDLTVAPEFLLPISQSVSLPVSTDHFSSGLAVKPFTTADMVVEFIQRSIPRKKLGEVMGSAVQASVLQSMRTKLIGMLSLETSEEEVEFNRLYDLAVTIVGQAHASYENFKDKLAPAVKDLQRFSIENGLSYIPPHAFLIRATESISEGKTNGVVGWEYVGHGLHSSVLR